MRLPTSRLVSPLACILTTVLGAITLGWVGWLVWLDVTVWGKDIPLIFFGSRAGEPISLGVGMRVIYYFLIGLTPLLSGTLAFLRMRRKAPKPNRNHPLSIKPQKIKKKEPMDKEIVKKEKANALEARIFSGCLNTFGYLASRPKNTPIPDECIICQRLGDCMVATVKTK